MPRDYLKLHLLILIWGFTSILGHDRFISLPAIELVFYRTLLAGVAIGIWLKLAGGGILDRPRTLLIFLGVGAIIGIHWILFFLAVKLSSVSICMVGISTLSLWTATLEPLLIKDRKFKIYELGLGIIVVFAIILIYQFEKGQSLGLTIAILSGLMAAVFAVINGQLVKDNDYRKITGWEMLGAALFCLICFPVYSRYFTAGDGLQLAASMREWVCILILALVCTVYAYSAYIELLNRLSVFTINLSANMEPVYGIILGALILGDFRLLTVNFYAAAGLIAVTLILHPVLEQRYGQAKG